MNRIYLYPYAGPGGRNYFKQIGTIQDLELHHIDLQEDSKIGFYCGDADEAGNADDLIFEGFVHFDSEVGQWYAIVDENSYRRASDDRSA